MLAIDLTQPTAAAEVAAWAAQQAPAGLAVLVNTMRATACGVVSSS
ncbi:hypothetical protein [Hymenobacter psoromatis]|nr:hypothetical protein [Hymenobacter psoromatis]